MTLAVTSCSFDFSSFSSFFRSFRSAPSAPESKTTTEPKTKAIKAPKAKAGAVSTDERAIAERVFSLVNATRAKAGKRALRGHSGLIAFAQKQSKSLSKRRSTSTAGMLSRVYYAHLRHSVDGMREFTYRASAGTSGPAGKAVASWSHGSGKRGQLLQGWHVIGVGVTKSSTPAEIKSAILEVLGNSS